MPLKGVQLITDGSCLVNPGGPGGWACILRCGEHWKELSGSADATTNNRMEMQAVIEGLKALNQPCTVEVVTDSMIVANGINKHMERWRVNGFKRGKKEKNELPNRDLWMELSRAMEGHRVTAVHVRGHQDHSDNNRCDELAGAAARMAQVFVQSRFQKEQSNDDPIEQMPAAGGPDLELPEMPLQCSARPDRLDAV